MSTEFIFQNLSPPEFPMKNEERIMFLAEQHFLRSVAENIAPESDPITQYQSFFHYLQDISSTEMAQQIFWSYGLTDSCYSSVQVSKAYGVKAQTVNTNRRLVLQTLYLLHPKTVDDLPGEKRNYLEARYLRHLEDESIDNQKTRVFERAKWNISYLQDRSYIKSREDDILQLLGDMYGAEKAELFARYYRLGGYSHSESFERSGNIEEIVTTDAFRLQLMDALEAGRAISEHMHDEDIGLRSWTNNKGKQVSGYRRMGERFESALGKHYRQLEIIEAFQEADDSVLLPLERELLLYTIRAHQEGSDKNIGIQAFNEDHDTQLEWTSVRRIEGKLLGAFEGNTVYKAQRSAWIEEVLSDSESMRQAYSSLADTVYHFHVEKMTLEQIADEIGLNRSYTGELKRMLDKLISGYLITNPATQRRGDITSQMIDDCFDDQIFLAILHEIIGKMPKTDSLVGLAEEYKATFNIRPQEVFALSILVSNIAREDV